MIPLTYLYAPADRPELVIKAHASSADVVIVDLEDAVAPSRKPDARRWLSCEAAIPTNRPVQVRINAPDSPWHKEDLRAAGDLPAHVELRVAKVQSPHDVKQVQDSAPGRPIHALLETPLAIERSYDIATAGVTTIGLGEADLRSALGVATAEHLAWQRSRVVNAAAAAGLMPPAMSVYANVKDEEGLRASCREGRAFGFLGRAAIHPRQLPVIRDAFMPSDEEAARARSILERFTGALDEHSGTAVLSDGTFIDVAMIESARRTIHLVDAARELARRSRSA